MGLRTPVIQIVSGIGFTEGPVWTSQGRLLVVSMSRGLIYEVDVEEGGATPVAEPGGGPNGMAQDAGGALWIAQNGGRHRPTTSTRQAVPSIQCWRDGEVRDVVTDRVTAPNDCAVGPDGRLWFTDPLGQPFEGETPAGRIWALDPDAEELELVAEGPLWPNGLAFGADPDELYVAETRTGRIVRFRRTAEGIVGPSVFTSLDKGSPDGLAFDESGELFTALPDVGQVVGIGPAGDIVSTIELGEGSFPTNLCFGGSSLARLFITAASGGRVLAIERVVPGLPLSR